ncbi:MAG: hypothetical protein SFV32_12555 [Opitutaceae bacterium]|nr:hypothetical protein [Opitutaceae bacterium]
MITSITSGKQASRRPQDVLNRRIAKLIYAYSQRVMKREDNIVRIGYDVTIRETGNSDNCIRTTAFGGSQVVQRRKPKQPRK